MKQYLYYLLPLLVPASFFFALFLSSLPLSSPSFDGLYISLGFDWDYSNDKWKIVNESEPLWVESKYVQHTPHYLS